MDKFTGMIKANELRIGNWVLYKGNPCQLDAYATTVDRIQGVRFGDIWTGFENIDPMPLTSKLLDKCGFIDRGSLYRKDGFLLLKRPEGLLFAVVDQIINYRPIMHLHQLQNLYYALTGQELELNL